MPKQQSYEMMVMRIKIYITKLLRGHYTEQKKNLVFFKAFFSLVIDFPTG